MFPSHFRIQAVRRRMASERWRGWPFLPCSRGESEMTEEEKLWKLLIAILFLSIFFDKCRDCHSRMSVACQEFYNALPYWINSWRTSSHWPRTNPIQLSLFGGDLHLTSSRYLCTFLHFPISPPQPHFALLLTLHLFYYYRLLEILNCWLDFFPEARTYCGSEELRYYCFWCKRWCHTITVLSFDNNHIGADQEWSVFWLMRTAMIRRASFSIYQAIACRHDVTKN